MGCHYHWIWLFALPRILTDCGTTFRGNRKAHEYQLYLAVGNIDHSKTRVKSPQSNGICGRFQKTVLNEFYQVAFRKKIHTSIDEFQADVEVWIKEYNEQRPHSGKYCFGKTPMQTFSESATLGQREDDWISSDRQRGISGARGYGDACTGIPRSLPVLTRLGAATAFFSSKRRVPCDAIGDLSPP